MINIAEQYDKTLEKILYNKNYNIKIHAVQTALNLLDYTDIENVNVNTIKYGCYDVNTENMILQFQKDNDIHANGILNYKTWKMIFDKLADEKDLIIIQTGEKEITPVDMDNYIEILSQKELTHPNLNSQKTLQNDKQYPNSNSSKSFINGGSANFDNDLIGNINGQKTHPNLDVIGPNFDDYYWDTTYGENSSKTPSWFGDYNLNGNEIFDNLLYNYIKAGGKYYNSVSYSHNLSGENEWNEEYITPNYVGASDKDYDFIYNLLSNSIYKNWSYENNPIKSAAVTENEVGVYGGSFESSTNKPFFHPSNIKQLRKSKFDITIVYGAKGENARKIIDVTPISVSQQMDASGEPLYDIYEFIARDVVYDNANNINISSDIEYV